MIPSDRLLKMSVRWKSFSFVLSKTPLLAFPLFRKNASTSNVIYEPQNHFLLLLIKSTSMSSTSSPLLSLQHLHLAFIFPYSYNVPRFKTQIRYGNFPSWDGLVLWNAMSYIESPDIDFTQKERILEAFIICIICADQTLFVVMGKFLTQHEHNFFLST